MTPPEIHNRTHWFPWSCQRSGPNCCIAFQRQEDVSVQWIPWLVEPYSFVLFIRQQQHLHNTYDYLLNSWARAKQMHGTAPWQPCSHGNPWFILWTAYRSRASLSSPQYREYLHKLLSVYLPLAALLLYSIIFCTLIFSDPSAFLCKDTRCSWDAGLGTAGTPNDSELSRVPRLPVILLLPSTTQCFRSLDLNLSKWEATVGGMTWRDLRATWLSSGAVFSGFNTHWLPTLH